MPRTKRRTANLTASATLGFEAELWAAANALRGSMDAAEYKHVVLGLIFLKYISDAFEAHHAKLEAERDQGADPEDPDEYRAEGIFWVPPEARWEHLKKNARQSTIGQLVDDAMAAVERDNPSLKGVLPKDYARPALDKQRLGQLIDLVTNIHLGGGDNHARDILGRVYEYFLGQFASAEGKKGGEFYTPRCIVKLLVEMLRPYRGRVYDPCCGSGGMFVQSEEFIEAHGGRIGDISVYGQELNYTTWRLAKMNLAANFAWVQHMIHPLAPTGLGGYVLEGGSMSSNQSGEGEMRKSIIEADLVDCMVALPGQLFYSTQLPACLWFLARDKKNGRFRDRRGQVLFIDARKLARMVDRTQRARTDRRGHSEDRRHLPRLARRPRRGRVPRRLRLLQERHAGGDPPSRLRPHARPLRRGRGDRG